MANKESNTISIWYRVLQYKGKIMRYLVVNKMGHDNHDEGAEVNMVIKTKLSNLHSVSKMGIVEESRL